jgi:hypothetical protein
MGAQASAQTPADEIQKRIVSLKPAPHFRRRSTIAFDAMAIYS